MRTTATVVTAVVCLCALNLSATASARNAPGSPQWCAHHQRSTRPACRPAGGGSSPGVKVTVSPNPIVETGGSDVDGVLFVEVDPVYAEQSVEIVSGLSDRCGQGVTWITDEGMSSGATTVATIDDDGNATVTFLGSSCAAGSVQVTANVEAGTDPTGTATVTIDPPAPMI